MPQHVGMRYNAYPFVGYATERRATLVDVWVKSPTGSPGIQVTPTEEYSRTFRTVRLTKYADDKDVGIRIDRRVLPITPVDGHGAITAKDMHACVMDLSDSTRAIQPQDLLEHYQKAGKAAADR